MHKYTRTTLLAIVAAVALVAVKTTNAQQYGYEQHMQEYNQHMQQYEQHMKQYDQHMQGHRPPRPRRPVEILTKEEIGNRDRFWKHNLKEESLVHNGVNHYHTIKDCISETLPERNAPN